MPETEDNYSILPRAKEVYAEHSEIIKLWIKGPDPFKQAMAETIMEAAGVCNF